MGIIQTIEGDLGKLFGFLRKEEKALMAEIVGELKALRADVDALKGKPPAVAPAPAPAPAATPEPVAVAPAPEPAPVEPAAPEK
jgi:hypothetical protein